MMRGRLYLALAIDGIILFLLIRIPYHAYAWMREIDASMVTLPEDDSRGMRIAFTGALAVIGLLNHRLIAHRLGRRARLMHCGIVALMVAVWIYRFLLPA